jgi:hypothetical protein
MSTFANLAKKYGDNHEGLTPNYWEVTLTVLNGTAAPIGVADAQALYQLPINAMLVSAQMNINIAPTVSGAFTLSIERTVGTTDVHALNVDLTNGALSIAAASGLKHDYTDITNTTTVFRHLRQYAGATYSVCVDAVPGGTVATILTVTLGFVSL